MKPRCPYWCRGWWLRWHLAYAKERMIDLLVWRILPRSVVLHCAIRVVAHATTGKWSSEVVPEVTAITCIERWSEDATA